MRRFISALVLMTLAGCASETPAPDSDIRPGKLEPTTGPYVSVAVDNHFHDVHPEDDITFSADRPFVVRNEGSNLHNVTIVETDFSEDVRPGKFVSMTLGPGTYTLICKYHSDDDMTGSFTVE